MKKHKEIITLALCNLLILGSYIGGFFIEGVHAAIAGSLGLMFSLMSLVAWNEIQNENKRRK